MTDPILTISNANLSLDGNAGRVDILHDVSLTVASGETLGLITHERVIQITLPNRINWITNLFRINVYNIILT